MSLLETSAFLDGASRYFQYARERYSIYLLRQGGQEAPWTTDPVLRSFRFCNIFREDDVVTEWFAEYVRGPMGDTPETVFACIAFRFFNTVSTGEIMLRHDLFQDWCPKRARMCLSGLRPLVTGAYMVKTPVGVKPKLEGLIQILDPIWENREALYTAIKGGTLEQAHLALMEFPWVGPFMAYEAVTDLRFTPVLADAPDVSSWANAGPGAIRGINRVCTGDPAVGPQTLRQRVSVMKELLHFSKNAEYWPSAYPSWEMREVEHTLCEFDKYERARLGQGQPKQRYKG